MKGTERQVKMTDGSLNPAPPTNGLDAAVRGETTIDQVRDLLFGGAQRSIESNLSGLRDEMLASLAQLQADFTKELASLQAKVQQLEQDTEHKRLASLRDIGASISQLGAAITGLGSDRAGK
ncbi:hypothetical protein [Bradyrhizobium sp. 2TAF24]|uniref:hypothetical protein n=1 Tax=Bradyrhizobium sp. 2TAF24 TaxID=3233011 RepID=UPI003F8F3012